MNLLETLVASCERGKVQSIPSKMHLRSYDTDITYTTEKFNVVESFDIEFVSQWIVTNEVIMSNKFSLSHFYRSKSNYGN